VAAEMALKIVAAKFGKCSGPLGPDFSFALI